MKPLVSHCRRILCRPAVVAVLGPLILVGPAPASAHAHAHAHHKPARMTEAQLRRWETRFLGAAHAAEHAHERAVWRNKRLRAGILRAERAAKRARLRAMAASVPSQDGQWSSPFSIPAVGIHAALLSTGKVLWFHRPQSTAGKFQIAIWDPVTGQSKEVPPPLLNGKPANFFCGAQSFLADGRLLVVGGQIAPWSSTTTDKGLQTLYTFNPYNETWTRQPDMAHGRWYPTSLLLADGRTMIMSGKDESGTIGAPYNNDIEIFTPSPDLDGVGTVQLLGRRAQAGKPPGGGLYPHMFAMPSGRTLIAGPWPVDSWMLDSLGAGLNYSWSDIADPADHRYGNGVILPSNTAGSSKVELIGGGTTATTVNEVFDEANPGAGWVAAPGLQVPRKYANTVMLPDGSMVLVGGGTDDPKSSSFVPDDLDVELYNPADGTWRRGAAQVEGRAYHSTAVLLPDGRVISAGDDTNGGYTTDTAEIYSPPYLFRGTRPRITAAPSAVGYGESFTVDHADSDVAKAVLIAPGATTHAVDMSQRYVPLTITQDANGTVTLRAPANANIAPPSKYMLFLVNADGVPSEARFVRVGAPAAPPPSGPSLTATPSAAAFGAVDLGSNKTLTVDIKNTGDADATVAAPAIGGPDSDQFSVAGGGFTLTPGATHSVDVTFAPSTAGSKGATLSLDYGTAAGSPLTIGLSGTGNDPSGGPATRTVTVLAEADTMVKQAAPTTNFGSVTPLLNDKQEAGASTAIQTYLRFTIPALNSDETITAAGLALDVTDPTDNGPQVWRTATTWSETGLTWNTRPARTSSAPIGNFGPIASAGRATTPLSGITGAGTVSLQLYPESIDGMAFSAFEDIDSNNRPQLVLTVTRGSGPPPPTDTTPPPAPTVTPASGTYTAPQSVTMADSEAGAEIRYTVGSGTTVPADPTATTGTVYSGPVTVSSSQVIKAAAFDAAGNRSTIVRRDYTITTGTGGGTRTVTVNPDADTMVKQAAPTTNFGSVTPLLNDKQEAGASTAIQTYLRFTIPALGAGETITGVSLSLDVTDPTDNGPQVWRTSPSWTESGLTWNTRPSRLSSAAIGNFGAIPVAGRVTTPVSGVTAAGQVSLQLYPESVDGVAFTARDDLATAARPQLIVTISGG